MTTIACRDCGGDVSRRAAACPRCGRVISGPLGALKGLIIIAIGVGLVLAAVWLLVIRE